MTVPTDYHKYSGLFKARTSPRITHASHLSAPYLHPIFTMSTSHPAVELMFVNIARPQDIKDRKTQRRINSHVMKPIGITRRRARPDDKTEIPLKSVKSLSQYPVIAYKSSLASSNTSSPGTKVPETSPWSLEYRHSLNLVPSVCSYPKPSRYPISARTSSMLHFC